MNATRLLTPCLLLIGSLGLQASVSYSVTGSTYSQSFDTLPSTPLNASLGTSPNGWLDDSASPAAGQFSIPGWYLYHPTSVTEGGANGHQRLRASTGSSGTGAFYSFGSAALPGDRALGSVGANTLAPDGQTGNDAGNLYFALRLSNNTLDVLDNITVGFTGEQWRDSGAAVAETMSFGWSTSALAVNDPSLSFNNVSSLAWTSPQASASIATLDGNAAANRVVLAPVTITGINWLPGTDLWLRWTDPQLSGKVDQGMSIDDFSLSAAAVAPEPSVMALLGLAGAGLFALRRKK
jgi:hypothetical protein